MRHCHFCEHKLKSTCVLKKKEPSPSVKRLRLEHQFTYLGSNISFTERDVNICLMKVGNAIDRLAIIWKSDLSDKVKQHFF